MLVDLVLYTPHDILYNVHVTEVRIHACCTTFQVSFFTVVKKIGEKYDHYLIGHNKLMTFSINFLINKLMSPSTPIYSNKTRYKLDVLVQCARIVCRLIAILILESLVIVLHQYTNIHLSTTLY